MSIVHLAWLVASSLVGCSETCAPESRQSWSRITINDTNGVATEEQLAEISAALAAFSDRVGVRTSPSARKTTSGRESAAGSCSPPLSSS